MIVSVVYLLARRIFALMVLRGRGEASKDIELLVLRHEVAMGCDEKTSAIVGTTAGSGRLRSSPAA